MYAMIRRSVCLLLLIVLASLSSIGCGGQPKAATATFSQAVHSLRDDGDSTRTFLNRMKGELECGGTTEEVAGRMAVIADEYTAHAVETKEASNDITLVWMELETLSGRLFVAGQNCFARNRLQVVIDGRIHKAEALADRRVSFGAAAAYYDKAFNSVLFLKWFVSDFPDADACSPVPVYSTELYTTVLHRDPSTGKLVARKSRAEAIEDIISITNSYLDKGDSLLEELLPEEIQGPVNRHLL